MECCGKTMKEEKGKWSQELMFGSYTEFIKITYTCKKCGNSFNETESRPLKI